MVVPLLLGVAAAVGFGLYTANKTGDVVDGFKDATNALSLLLAGAGLAVAGGLLFYFGAVKDRAHWFPLAIVLTVISLPFFGVDFDWLNQAFGGS